MTEQQQQPSNDDERGPVEDEILGGNGDALIETCRMGLSLGDEVEEILGAVQVQPLPAPALIAEVAAPVPTVRLVSRMAWRARSPRQAPVHLDSTRGVKVHYTGSYVNPLVLSDHGRCAPMVRGIQNSHMDSNGWNDIAYSALVCPHAFVFVGRGPHHLPAANGPGLNSGHYAVCALIGSSGLTIPSEPLKHGLRDAINWLRSSGRAGSEIKGHRDGYRDGYSTDCPGERLYAWVRSGAVRPGTPTPAPTLSGHAPPWPGRYLIQPPPMRGDDVTSWQSQMRHRGWSIGVDGWYGPASESTCRSFQQEKNLRVDGVVGSATWRASWEVPVT